MASILNEQDELMAFTEVKLLPLRMSEYEKSSPLPSPSPESWSSNPTDAVIFAGISLVLGIACRQLLKGTRVPYTVALLVIGIGLGALEYGTSHRLGKIGDGIRLWASIDPDLLLAVFLPALLFESSFSMEVHQIKRCIVQIFLLAGPGVLISTFCLGSAVKLTFPYNWGWQTSLLLGALLSASDPVAVVAVLKELGAGKKLTTITDGESLMNDGVAIVVYQLFFRLVVGWRFNLGSIIKFLAQVSLGSVAMGLAFGIVSVLWLGFVFSDTVIEFTLTLAVSYVAYFTAQQGADISGILTVMTLGMFLSFAARTAFKGESHESLHHFWEMVAYIANTLIFILSGVVMAEGILSNESILKTHENSWGYVFLLYAFALLARAVVVGVLYPLLCYFGYGLHWKEAIMLVWSGLRGAVSLSLALSFKRSSDNSSLHISSDTGFLFLFFTSGIVFLTLIINGSTAQFLLHFLDMDKLSAAKKRILQFTKFEMLNKALEAFDDLGEDEELGPADWTIVKRYISTLEDVDGERVHPHTSYGDDSQVDHMNLKDIRIRLLNGVQSAYWKMLNEGRITQNTGNLLMQSVDEALDLVSHEALCDWRGLQSYVSIPNYYKFLQRSILPQKLVTFFTVERLESACYICAAFLRAHRIARQQLHCFIGDSEIASLVIKESEEEGEAAKKFLDEVRTSFPQVLHVVKNRQVTHSVLNHLIDYVNNLEKIGLLEENEMVHLHDAVQTDMKKLLRNPPLVKIPKMYDLIMDNPLLGALPAAVRDTFIASTKQAMKLRDSTLYKQGSKPNGVWLISNGVVKWTGTNVRNKDLLHPTFTHGSTLGLYEVLVGMPYICDIVTDSLVICFFIKAEKILASVRSDPVVEDIFWRESVIVLSKILLPQAFEEMTMQDLRVLIAERSTMNIYVGGEILEIPPHSIGFLLEGFVKAQGHQVEQLSSPAVLSPLYGDHCFRKSETSGARVATSHQASWYQVETRSRVIVLDIAGFEASKSPQGRSSLLISHSVDHSSGDHGKTMTWPEHFPTARQHHNDEKTNEQKSNLSTRSTQILRTQSLPEIGKKKQSHNQSCPQVPLSYEGPRVFIKSEGASTSWATLEVQEKKAPPQDSSSEKNQPQDKSSDKSGAQDEHVIRIDSPSRLSFRRAS